MIQIDGLSKWFDLHIANQMHVKPLRNISFDVEPGKFMGLAGPSGIGKSTILKCIYRTYLPSEGSIWYDSAVWGKIDLATANERQILHLRRNEISYISQFLRVIPRVTAVDIVAERLTARGVTRADAIEQVKLMLQRLALPEKIWDAFPATFSGGEQQRLNIARALISQPRLLLLDEPTASLDYRTKTVVLDLLHEAKKNGTTMIGVFHDLEWLKQIADDTVTLDPSVHAAPLQQV